MVRFIIKVVDFYSTTQIKIYIPIWLDLLLYKVNIFPRLPKDLHSNMVRFIIPSNEALQYPIPLFTFQYG